MFHQYTDDEGLDTPKQLEALYDLGLAPLIPFLVGGASVGATLLSWNQKETWTEGDYNNYMRQMNDTIKAWDKLGWSSGCWRKFPARREGWMAFWARFSKHYKQYPTNPGRLLFSDTVIASAEAPARKLMRELAAWGDWLSKACGADTEISPTPKPEPVPPPANGGGSPTGDIADIVKWGAIGIGLLFAFNVYQGTRVRRY